MSTRMVSATSLALAAVLSLAFTPAPVSNASTEWVIDASHSKVAFNVRHFFTPVNGSFDAYEADVRFSPDDLANSSIQVTIDVKSVNTDNQRRDEHLMSGDFFNAETWGAITFNSSTITSTGDNTYVATGELTIRDVTRTIDLPFTLLGVMDHPWQPGKKVAGITASTKLNRNDYGVGTGDWAATAVIGDEVTINIDLELNTK